MSEGNAHNSVSDSSDNEAMLPSYVDAASMQSLTDLTADDQPEQQPGSKQQVDKQVVTATAASSSTSAPVKTQKNASSFVPLPEPTIALQLCPCHRCTVLGMKQSRHTIMKHMKVEERERERKMKQLGRGTIVTAAVAAASSATATSSALPKRPVRTRGRIVESAVTRSATKSVKTVTSPPPAATALPVISDSLPANTCAPCARAGLHTCNGKRPCVRCTRRDFKCRDRIDLNAIMNHSATSGPASAARRRSAAAPTTPKKVTPLKPVTTRKSISAKKSRVAASIPSTPIVTPRKTIATKSLRKRHSTVSRAVVTSALKHTPRKSYRGWPLRRELVPTIDGSDSEDFCFTCRKNGAEDECGELLICEGICAHAWHIGEGATCVKDEYGEWITEPPADDHWWCNECRQGSWPELAKLDSSCRSEVLPTSTPDPSKEAKKTILMAACHIHEKDGRLEWMRHLYTNVEHVRASVVNNEQDDSGCTVLHHAVVEFVPIQDIMHFLDMGADVNIEDEVHTIAAHHAFSRQYIPAVLCFLTRPELDLTLRARGHHTLFQDCVSRTGLGPGMQTQGLKGWFKFQLYFAFALRFMIQQEFIEHRPFKMSHGVRHLLETKDQVKIDPHLKQANSSSVTPPIASSSSFSSIDPSTSLTSEEQLERRALFLYAEERFAYLKPNLLRFVLILLTKGAKEARTFSAKDYDDSDEIDTAAAAVATANQPPVDDQMEIDGEFIRSPTPSAAAAAVAAGAAVSSTPSSVSPRKSSSRTSSSFSRTTTARTLARQICRFIIDASTSSSQVNSLTPLECVQHASDELEHVWCATFDRSIEFGSLSEYGVLQQNKLKASTISKKPSRKRKSQHADASASKSATDITTDDSQRSFKRIRISDQKIAQAHSTKKKLSTIPHSRKRTNTAASSKNSPQLVVEAEDEEEEDEEEEDLGYAQLDDGAMNYTMWDDDFSFSRSPAAPSSPSRNAQPHPSDVPSSLNIIRPTLSVSTGATIIPLSSPSSSLSSSSSHIDPRRFVNPYDPEMQYEEHKEEHKEERKEAINLKPLESPSSSSLSSTLPYQRLLPAMKRLPSDVTQLLTIIEQLAQPMISAYEREQLKRQMRRVLGYVSEVVEKVSQATG